MLKTVVQLIFLSPFLSQLSDITFIRNQTLSDGLDIFHSPFKVHSTFFHLAFYYVCSDLDIIHATGYIEDVQEDVRKFITKSLYY